MTMMQIMPICILCGHTSIIWKTMCGIKPEVGSMRLAYIIYKEHLNITMYYLLTMPVNIVKLDNGK